MSTERHDAPTGHQRRPREAPRSIATLAGDAAAAARFLSAQAGIDRARVGFYGISQGGWIIPQAVVRATGIGRVGEHEPDSCALARVRAVGANARP